jgi:CRP/FNR family transcriptional regulator
VTGSRSINKESLIEASSLSAVDLFRGVPPECLERIQEMSDVREYSAGHMFFRHGEKGEVLFILESGHVQTFRTSGAKKLIIADLKPPAVFGEMSCAGQHMYHCSAQATQPSRIRSLSSAAMETILAQYPEITRRLLDLVSQRFLEVLVNLEDTSFRPLIPRLARLLLDNAVEDSVSDLTHKEIAERLRVYRESATSALGELRKAGIIAIERKRIRIMDRGRLERASRE